MHLIAAQLSHFGDLLGARILISGPPLNLSIAAAQTLGIATHELATNAVKHGALSDEKGVVEITWAVESQPSTEDRFIIDWIERLGPPTSAPTVRGFGTKVVKDMVEMSFDGDVVVDYAAAGFRWHVTCPLVKITEGRKEQAADR